MRSILLLSMLLITPPCLAQDASSSVQQTQQMLRDPSTRPSMLSTTDAKNADAQVDLITKGNQQQKEQIYALSSDLLPNLATQANADPERMSLILMQAMQNPQGFYNTWSAEQKANFQGLVNDMEATQGRPQANP